MDEWMEREHGGEDEERATHMKERNEGNGWGDAKGIAGKDARRK